MEGHYLENLRCLEYLHIFFTTVNFAQFEDLDALFPDPLILQEMRSELSIQTLRDCLVESDGCFDAFRNLIQERDRNGFGLLFGGATADAGQPNLRYLHLREYPP